MTTHQASKLSPSKGFTTRQVTVAAITTDHIAVCVDKTGVEVRVPLLWHKAKAQLPEVGEQWMVSQEKGRWVFDTILGTDPSQFPADLTGNGWTINGTSWTLTPAGLVAPSGWGFTSAGLTGSGWSLTPAGFAGTDWVENSTGRFLYSGTPAAGKLVYSETRAPAGVDGFGNTYIQGSVSYNTTATSAANFWAVQNWAGQISLWFTTSLSVVWTQENWHNFGVPSGWTNNSSGTGRGFRYKMIPGNRVLIDVDMQAPSSAPADGTTIGTLTGDYLPVTQGNVPLATTNMQGGGNQSCHLNITTAGAVKCYAINGSAIIVGTGEFPLD